MGRVCIDSKGDHVVYTIGILGWYGILVAEAGDFGRFPEELLLCIREIMPSVGHVRHLARIIENL